MDTPVTVDDAPRRDDAPDIAANSDEGDRLERRAK
jgi:hypothetical protein